MVPIAVVALIEGVAFQIPFVDILPDPIDVPPGLIRSKLLSVLESLGKSLAGGLREEKGGDCPGEGTEAEDDGGKDGGDLGEVDNHRGEEDRDATDNFTEGNPLSTDDCGEYLAAVLEADEESTVGGHPANQGDGQAN